MYRFEFLNKLKTALGDKVTITDEFDEIQRENFYSVSINLGTGFAGNYKGGYWGDCAITDDTLELNFLIGDIYEEGEEITCGEGYVHLKYKGGTEANGLAYTGALEKLVCEKVAKATNEIVEVCGSEQGMQGHYGDDESYLSLDVFV